MDYKTLLTQNVPSRFIVACWARFLFLQMIIFENVRLLKLLVESRTQN